MFMPRARLGADRCSTTARSGSTAFSRVGLFLVEVPDRFNEGAPRAFATHSAGTVRPALRNSFFNDMLVNSVAAASIGRPMAVVLAVRGVEGSLVIVVAELAESHRNG